MRCIFLYEITLNRTSLVGATGPARKKKSYFFFFVVFLVVFLDDFLADFLAMRFTSFQHVNVKIVKMLVNVFSKLAQKFSARTLARASIIRARASEDVERHSARRAQRNRSEARDVERPRVIAFSSSGGIGRSFLRQKKTPRFFFSALHLSRPK
jgi:hypothetical protein